MKIRKQSKLTLSIILGVTLGLICIIGLKFIIQINSNSTQKNNTSISNKNQKSFFESLIKKDNNKQPTGSSSGNNVNVSFDEGKESGTYLYYKPFTVPRAKNVYTVELSKFNISNDGTNSVNTTLGINKAIYYAYDNKYDGVKFPKGTYAINVDETPNCHGKGIQISQLENFEIILKDCTLKLEPCSEHYYRIMDVIFCKNLRITGGTFIGDRYDHNYGMRINNDGNDLVMGDIDPSTGKQIASDECAVTKDYIVGYTDWFTKKKEALPEKFYIIPIEGSTRNITDYGASVVHFYDDSNNYLGNSDKSFYRSNTPPSGATKMKIVFKEEKHLKEAKFAITKEKTTHEFGTALCIANSDNIVVNGIKAYDCAGDGIGTESVATRFPQKTVNNLKIINCDIGNNRRQGISLVGEGVNTIVKNSKIYNTNGTDPQCGIDIESNPETGRCTYVCLEGNTMQENRRWDVDIYNGSYVEVKDNTFRNGIAGCFSDTVSIYNNTFDPIVEHKDNNLKRIFNYLLYYDEGSHNTDVYNNTFKSSKEFEIYFRTNNGNMRDNKME